MERIPNEAQTRVIEELDNNLVLFASAGTGKTFTIARRVSRILTQNRAKPQEILCLTFTTKACEEMREDVARYVGSAANEVEIRTIHGFCYRLLREENRKRGDKYLDATVCDEADAQELLKSILSSQLSLWEGRDLPLDDELVEREFEIFHAKNALRNFISALKHVREEEKFYSDNVEEDYQKTFDRIRATRSELYDSMLGVSTKRGRQVRDEEFERAMTRFAGKLAFSYDDYLKKSNRVDYDDLVIFAGRYLDDEQTRAYWENRYKYIIVDEMQDTSLLEYSILKRIFGKNNLMTCGDFFQSIYEWRGSRPELTLRDFMQNFSPKVYMLSENYRSTKTLTEASFGYLKNSYPELVGKYCPAEIQVKSGEEGEKILTLGFDNRKEEAYKIYRYLKKSLEKDVDVCVMARSNFYLSALLRSFEEFNLEYPKEERLRFFTAEEQLQFFKKPLVKDVSAIFKLLFNKADRVSMERVTERYVRLVGVKTIERIRLFHSIGVSIVSFLDWQTYKYLDPYHVLVDAFEKGNIVVYDTETTGLNLKEDQILQLSAIRMDREGNILDTFDRMIEPTVPIDEGAYKTHGFDLEYIRAHGGVSAKTALESFSKFVQGAVLVGHNSSRFDAPLIERQLKENGLPPLEILAEYDTLSIAKEFHAALPDFRLSTLCFKYGVVNEAAHNAYGDIVATGQVLKRLLLEDIIPTAKERENVCAQYIDKFEKFYAFLEKLREKTKNSTAREVLSYLAEQTFLEKRYPSDSDQRALKALFSSFSNAEADTESFLREFTSQAELSGNSKLFFGEKNVVPLLTVHQAKGCEFDVVVLAGVDDRNFPNFYAKAEKTEEEEKRVFYVAISRAKKKLILTKAAYNGKDELFPSPYVAKIPERYLHKNERWELND